MISENESSCPKCGGQLKYYDHVKRIVRTRYGKKSETIIRRFRCTKCGTMHREIPEFIFQFKQYEAEIIIGVLEGLITCETLGFEDYPCEMTMIRWISQKSQLLYFRKKISVRKNHSTNEVKELKEYLELYLKQTES